MIDLASFPGLIPLFLFVSLLRAA